MKDDGGGEGEAPAEPLSPIVIRKTARREPRPPFVPNRRHFLAVSGHLNFATDGSGIHRTLENGLTGGNGGNREVTNKRENSKTWGLGLSPLPPVKWFCFCRVEAFLGLQKRNGSAGASPSLRTKRSLVSSESDKRVSGGSRGFEALDERLEWIGVVAADDADLERRKPLEWFDRAVAADDGGLAGAV
jgi:hypothetical protein